MGFIQDENHEMNIDQVYADYPEYCHIVKVDGGWHGFMTMTDYETWNNQV